MRKQVEVALQLKDWLELHPVEIPEALQLLGIESVGVVVGVPIVGMLLIARKISGAFFTKLSSVFSWQFSKANESKIINIITGNFFIF